ncbi:MAG: 1-phosphatidylinositol-3-phosphate 5-kinase [Icmadophila ericetorum]|nr:1-phosphatidylinositol-3-phosphate 5-kinase [Icmadophila ericetorum]
MASQVHAEMETPPLTASSYRQLKKRSRRGSIGSVSGTSHAEKELINQALDQIHSTESQCGTLTTFNEFTFPPHSLSGTEVKGITSELQGGLSGLYSRLRASVNGVKDIVGAASSAGDTEEDDGHTKSNGAATSARSSISVSKLYAAASASSSKNEIGSAKASQIPAISAVSNTLTKNSEKSANGVKPFPAPLNISLKAGLASPNLAKSSPILSTQTLSRGASRMAGDDGDGVNSLKEESHEGENRQPRVTSSPMAAENYTNKGLSGRQNIRPTTPSHQASGSANSSIMNGRALEPGGNNVPYTRDSKAENVSSNQTTTFDGPPDSIGREQSISSTSITSQSYDKKDNTKQAVEAAPRQNLSSSLLPKPRVPEVSLSRTSSSETATFIRVSTQTSSVQDASENESRSSSMRIAPKASATNQSNVDPRTANVGLSQNRTRVLSKEYWMKDENAKDCFYCGDAFSTFRRKHHCRTCGQIFDSKCTSLIPGRLFGQTGSIRVCKPCEGIINGYDDSSEFSDEGSVAGSAIRPRHGSAGASETPPPKNLFPSRMSDIKEHDVKPRRPSNSIPTMGIPATRRAGDDLSRRAAVLEIDSEQRLVRPTSSRSLKSGARPHTAGHKRHLSRNHLQRGKNSHEERAPFHRQIDDDSKEGRLPAFHSDNVIDPDLAAYLSGEETSGEEQMSLTSVLNGETLSRSVESERQGFLALASSKKGRSRMGDKSTIASRDADNVSLSGSRLTSSARISKRRNLSISSNMHLRPSPRTHRFSSATPTVGSNLHESISSSALDQLNQKNLRIIRSSSMRGADAPIVELNNASVQHVRRLLHQLLEDSKISNVSQWEKALMPILLQATDDVNPDVRHRGDDMDIRHYVKIKKIPGGRPGDTSYVSGLVFTKNLALKSMPRSISNPNILILTFPVEYARHQQHFMSLEPVIRQEREFLQNLVHRIAALRPQLLLVERNVSGLALEFLQQAKIATAYNVKPSVLEAVSRCCQTRIVSSIDKLAIKPVQAGTCASFYLKTYVNGVQKKTYFYLTGCPKELGCTIVLRGASNETLIKLKRITEFMTYVVYNLKLETCLMRDEFALIPSYAAPGTLSPNKDRYPKTISGIQRVQQSPNDCIIEASTRQRSETPNSSQGSSEMNTALKPPALESGQSEEIEFPEDIPMPTFYGDMVEKHKTKILSASPFVQFAQPYLLMRAREQERRLSYLKRLKDQDVREEQNQDEESKPQKFVLIKPEMVHESVQDAPKKVREVLHAVHDAEYDKALHSYRTQKKQWETYISGNGNLFDPFAHQNIAVLYSVVCTSTSVPCSGPDLVALGFYNEHEVDEDFEADCTLGQYVEDLCLSANIVCIANGCERKMIEHHRQYVHGDAQLSIFVENYPSKLRGYQDIILMWSTCRICGNDTQVISMSEGTWKYSFGKYLELSFWSNSLHARAGVCPHDIHRDHVRYFGFKDKVVRIQYDPVKILEIIVPRTRITWKVVNDLRFKNEVFTKAEERLNKFMGSVKARLKSINIESLVPEKVDACKEEIERLMKRVNDEHVAIIRKLQKCYMDCKYFEIIPLNRAVRAMQEKVAEWDSIFADFERNFFPSEKDIRRLATQQLKRMFLDRDDSMSSLNSNTEGVITTSDAESGERLAAEGGMVRPHTSIIPAEKARDMLTDTIRDHSAESVDRHKSAPTTAVPTFPAANLDSLQAAVSEHEDMRHLDLAVPTNFPQKQPDTEVTNEPETRAISPTTIHDEQLDLTPRATPVKLDPSANEMILQLPPPDFSMLPPKETPKPRPHDFGFRRSGTNKSPPLHRTQSQPAQAFTRRTEKGAGGSISKIGLPQHSTFTGPSSRPSDSVVSDTTIRPTEKKISDRLVIGTTRPGGVSTHSMIPRSIGNRRKDSRVSAIAKHFEQLTLEFQREKIRERRQRAARNKQARAYPTASSKPVVEIYQDVHEAVEEKEPSDEDMQSSSPSYNDSNTATDSMTQSTSSQMQGESSYTDDRTADETTAEDTAAEDTAAETDDHTHVDSTVGSDVENDANRSDEEHDLQGTPSIPDSEATLDSKLDIPKHEKSTFIKMLSNFWAERSASGWNALDYPLNASDHVFADSDIIIREDEPSSLIAFALDSEDYKTKLHSIQDKNGGRKSRTNESNLQDPMLDTEEQMEVEQALLRSTGTHLKYQFQEGSAKMLCKIFYAEQFDAVRRKCGVAPRIVESLSRCLKWDSKGGKTKSVFLKTLDDRFVLKSLSQIETQAFLRFAPAYFRIMSEALFHELPTVIAKMLGFYQIIIKNPVTGVEFNWFLLIMENLFYDRSPTLIFDLKGSMRNRRIQSTGEQNEVLLDENMVEFIYESPLFAREHSKKVLRASVWNDTLFLSRQNVMDYSLMIAIDEDRKELVVGIIDCIRTYTWDKKMESWFKDRGKNRPTVTSPREYKNRFREAMGRYVLQAPNCWHQFQAQALETRPVRFDERRSMTGSADVEDAVEA